MKVINLLNSVEISLENKFSTKQNFNMIGQLKKMMNKTLQRSFSKSMLKRDKLKDILQAQISEIKSAGLYKKERVFIFIFLNFSRSSLQHKTLKSQSPLQRNQF
jgi:ABC-type Na+ transport system ATPase subunit NatA